ncbi:MAG: hypothetical protein LBS03_10845 [Bacteroidales bacterium]|jgi:arylsulfatase A-like enzyme|nr:hypothetical protein [Bacteroidales bacterium]
MKRIIIFSFIVWAITVVSANARQKITVSGSVTESGSNQSLPGGKWTCWNLGVRSSLAAHYSARIQAGTETAAIIQYEDILPTLLDIAGNRELNNLADQQQYKKRIAEMEKELRKWMRQQGDPGAAIDAPNKNIKIPYSWYLDAGN